MAPTKPIWEWLEMLEFHSPDLCNLFTLVPVDLTRPMDTASAKWMKLPHLLRCGPVLATAGTQGLIFNAFSMLLV